MRTIVSRVTTPCLSACLLIATVLSGCGGSETAPTSGAPSRPTLSQSTLTVTAGAPSAATTLRVRASGAVSLSARAAEGIFVNFSPAVIAAGGDSSSVAIAASTTIPAGTYPISILATRSGGMTDTVALSLTVAAAPLTGTAVTLRYCAEDAPVWLAVRETNGLWTRLTPTTGNTYQFRVAASVNSVGIASVDTVDTGYHLRVMYVRDFELAGISDALGLGECGAGSVRGTVTNAGTPPNATVALAHQWAAIDGASSGQFTLNAVSAGTQDLIATRLDPVTSLPNKLLLRRGLPVAAGATLPALNFDAPEAFAPAQASVTLTGVGSDSVIVTTAFRGVGGRANGQIGRPVTYAGTVGTARIAAVPGAQLAPNELQQLTATTVPASSTAPVRSATLYFREPGTFTVDMAPVTLQPLVTRQAGGAYARARVLLGVESPYGRFVTATFAQPGEGRFASIFVTPTIAFQPWDFAVPDLSGVAGWNNDWGLRNTAPIAWSVTAAGGPNFRLGTTVSDGAVLRTMTQSGVLAAP